MIDVKELRIGNWLNEEVLGRVWVHEIMHASAWVVFKGIKTDGSVEESRQKIPKSDLLVVSQFEK